MFKIKDVIILDDPYKENFDSPFTKKSLEGWYKDIREIRKKAEKKKNFYSYYWQENPNKPECKVFDL